MRSRRRTRPWIVAAIVAAALSSAAWQYRPSFDGDQGATPATPPTSAPLYPHPATTAPNSELTAVASSTPPARPGDALEALDSLPVKGKAPMTGYNRTRNFGAAWLDTTAAPLSGNNCDTRNDILSRDLQDVRYRGDGTCIVSSGVLHDPYTGTVINFTRGIDTSILVQIDHVVALGNAWQTGAQSLSQDRREMLANDPLNLLAVSGDANAQKGKSNAAEWLPKNKAARCPYVARQIAVKMKYQLSVTGPEKEAMTRVLSTCPGQVTPTE